MIHALTNDPALALLLLKMVPSKLILHIQLSSPGARTPKSFITPPALAISTRHIL
jgi:hypothetical protein